MKKKYFDSRNLVVGLKAIGTTIVTSLIWAIPSWGVRYAQINVKTPFVAPALGLIVLLGYIHTWGFFSKIFWKFK